MTLAPAAERVVAVVAHPDDAELMCYGTLRRYRQLGAAATVVTVSRGAGGISHRRSVVRMAVADMSCPSFEQLAPDPAVAPPHVLAGEPLDQRLHPLLGGLQHTRPELLIQRGRLLALDDLDLLVITASPDELTAHESVLSELDKAVKGTSVWRSEAAVVENAEAAA